MRHAAARFLEALLTSHIQLHCSQLFPLHCLLRRALYQALLQITNLSFLSSFQLFFFFFYSMCVGATCYVRGQRIMLGQHKSVTVAYVKGQGTISSSAYWLPDQPTGMIAAGQERRWSGLRNHFLVSVLVVSGIVRRSCGSWWSESFWFTCKSWRQVAGEKIHFIKSKDTVCFSRCTTVDATDQWIISRFHFFLFFFFFFCCC